MPASPSDTAPKLTRLFCEPGSPYRRLRPLERAWLSPTEGRRDPERSDGLTAMRQRPPTAPDPKGRQRHYFARSRAVRSAATAHRGPGNSPGFSPDRPIRLVRFSLRAYVGRTLTTPNWAVAADTCCVAEVMPGSGGASPIGDHGGPLPAAAASAPTNSRTNRERARKRAVKGQQVLPVGGR